MAVAAVTADQQVRDRDVREQRIADQLVGVLQTVISKPPGQRTLADADLSQLPGLAGAIARAPVIRDNINAVGRLVDQRLANLAEQAGGALAMVIAKPANQPLTVQELEQFPELNAILTQQFPQLRNAREVAVRFGWATPPSRRRSRADDEPAD